MWSYFMLKIDLQWEVPFGGQKIIKQQTTDTCMKQKPTLVNIVWLIFTHWKIEFLPLSDTPQKEMSESCCDGGLVITKSFHQRKEELDQKLLSKKQVKIENAQSRYSNRTFSLF